MPRLMLPDPAATETDRILADLEKRIHKEYKQAIKEADKKWSDYLSAFDAQDKVEAERLAKGEITKAEYQDWRRRHLAQGKHWEDMRNTIAQDYHNRNLIAAKMTNGTMADVYALNANYGTYLVERTGKINTGFTLYNHDSAEALLKKEWSVSAQDGKDSFLPKPSAKKQRELAELKRTNPDVLWNSQKLQSAMMQGVLSGESMTKLASRLAGVAEMDEHQAIRTARTMTTNVQNKGRMDSFDRAKKLGVELVDEWNAILDGRTRHSHRHMHGERREPHSDEPFSNGCRWPGDPNGPPEEVYNCRCRIMSWVKGFEGDTVKENPAMGGMSFEQWQEELAPRNRNSNLTSGSDNGNMNTHRSSSTKINASGEVVNPMPTQEYNRIRNSLERNGVTVRAVLSSDEDDAFEYMTKYGIEASYVDGEIRHLGEIPSRGTLYEEIIHRTQERKYGILATGDEAEMCAREVEAARKLLKYKDAYRLDKYDVAALEENLPYWEKRFKREVGVSYDESHYRG